MSLFVAPDDWRMDMADTKNVIPGIYGQTAWELPTALDINLLHIKGHTLGENLGVQWFVITDPRASSERDPTSPKAILADGIEGYYADIMITVGMADKIFIMKDEDIAPSFLIELDGDMDTAERRATLIALGFREL